MVEYALVPRACSLDAWIPAKFYYPFLFFLRVRRTSVKGFRRALSSVSDLESIK